MTTLRTPDERRSAAFDMEEAAEEARARAALTLAMAISLGVQRGLLALPGPVLDLVAQYDKAHEAVLDAREAIDAAEGQA